MKQTDKKYIRLTKASVENMFDLCNTLYFDRMVEKPVKFETWTPHRKTLGMVRPVLTKKKGICSVMHISRRYRWTEVTLRHVVVHEMIHLAIGDYKEFLNFWQRLPLIGRYFIKEHNRDFVELMKDINDRFGLDIKIRFKEMREEFIG